MASVPAAPEELPAILRLAALATLREDELELLRAAARGGQRRIPMRREILIEGRPITEAVLILSGWACRVRMLSDGRRQILGFLVAGDLLGCCQHARPVASTTVVALTDVSLCAAPPPPHPLERGRGLAEAYAVSAALDEYYQNSQIARIGRLTAYERIADLFLELSERLTLAGLASRSRLPMPLTQETMADALGLTSVHVNRMLQSLRRDGALVLQGGYATLRDPAALAEQVDRRPVMVTANREF